MTGLCRLGAQSRQASRGVPQCGTSDSDANPNGQGTERGAGSLRTARETTRQTPAPAPYPVPLPQVKGIVGR